MDPFSVLLIGVAFVVIAIAVLKVHPFFALILAAVLVGILSPEELPVPEDKAHLPQATRAIEVMTREFGALAAGIGIVIAMAAVIGQALMESGAADRITRRFLSILGEARAQYALLGSGYVLSVPVFFDTVFFLLVPLARALRVRTGRNFLLYVMAICAGGVVTHGLVPPTPGPLVMVENLDLDLGIAILGGFLLGLPVALLGGVWLPRLLARRIDPPLRDTAGSSLEELEKVVQRPDEELPGFLASIAPVALPVILITAHSILDAWLPETATVVQVTSFLGDKIFALGLGMAIALWVLARQKGWSMQRLMAALEPALQSAGVIILITCAGGAFGNMLKHTGLRTAVEGLAPGGDQGFGLVLILIAWGLTATMKVAQGSGTAAMIVGSAVMGQVIAGQSLPFHPIYIYAAVAYGSKFISWMNDSGFWVVCRMSGFTERETLRTWTVQLGFMGVVGLIEVLVLSQLLPFAPEATTPVSGG